MSASSPLHAAAIELIPTASIPTIRAILLMLLDVPAAAIPRAVGPPPSPTPPRPGRQKAARRAPANGTDSQWESLRQQVRAGMTRQSLDYADLAAAVGCSASTMRVTLGRRQPASKRLVTALRAWLAANGERAPEVATPAIPFRSRSAERRGNGGGAAAAESVVGVPAEA
jgi:hypothetical protein